MAVRLAAPHTPPGLRDPRLASTSPLKPSYLERPLPAGLFRAGENVLEPHKDEGSRIAYDAIGVFARRG
ncbi:hypothetical protein ACWEV3_21955 [Saccharopolyspora sp. NPDC003752]